jgi:hypothetical protein
MSWLCAECGKWHLAFRTKCGKYRRCAECNEEDLNFARGLCSACYQRAIRREKRERRSMAICARCGKSFKRARADAHYCSNACRQAAYRQREQIGGRKKR